MRIFQKLICIVFTSALVVFLWHYFTLERTSVTRTETSEKHVNRDASVLEVSRVSSYSLGAAQAVISSNADDYLDPDNLASTLEYTDDKEHNIGSFIDPDAPDVASFTSDLEEINIGNYIPVEDYELHISQEKLETRNIGVYISVEDYYDALSDSQSDIQLGDTILEVDGNL